MYDLQSVLMFEHQHGSMLFQSRLLHESLQEQGHEEHLRLLNPRYGSSHPHPLEVWLLYTIVRICTNKLLCPVSLSRFFFLQLTLGANDSGIVRLLH